MARNFKSNLSVNQKNKKYKTELKSGQQITADGELKKDKHGNVRTLSSEQRAYRQGYSRACQDVARAINKQKR